MRSTTKYDYKRIFRLQSEGWTLRRIADRWRLDYERLKKAVWRKNQELGITAAQRKYMEQSLDLGLWVDEDRRQKREEDLLANIRRETDDALDGIAISYVIGLPPEMEFVYINSLAEEVYQTRTEQAEGVSVWELMADPAIYNRVVNLEEYHQKGVMVAKALLEIGNRIGPPFSNRVDHTLKPYVEFAKARLLNCGAIFRQTFLPSPPSTQRCSVIGSRGDEGRCSSP